MPEIPLLFADKPPIFPDFNAGNPGQHQQLIRMGLGVSIIVTLDEVTDHIPAMQIE